MLTTVAIVPDHPVCIPDIGGEYIKEVEQSVNGLMKLAIKLHAEKVGLLVCLSSGLPILHHRLAFAKGDEFVRFFESNTVEGREVHMTFPGATDLYTSAELMLKDQKVPLEGFVQEHKTVAIDNSLLSFLFYCHSIAYYPELLVLGGSDLSTAKHYAAGKAIGNMLRVQQDISSAVILSGSTLDLDEIDGTAPTKVHDGMQWTDTPNFAGSLQIPAEIACGILSTLPDQPAFRLMGQDTFDEKEFSVGYFRAFN